MKIVFIYENYIIENIVGCGLTSSTCCKTKGTKINSSLAGVEFWENYSFSNSSAIGQLWNWLGTTGQNICLFRKQVSHIGQERQSSSPTRQCYDSQ